MTFLEELKEIYTRNNLEFPNIEITDFMLDFIERLYRKLLSSTIKNSDQLSELLMQSYEESLIDNASIVFNDEITDTKLVSGNCECIKYIPIGNSPAIEMVEGEERDTKVHIEKLIYGFRKNNSMREPSDEPKGLQEIIDSFDDFWKKTEWSKNILKGTCRFDVQDIECGICPTKRNVPKYLILDNKQKTELESGIKNFFSPKHSYKVSEVSVAAILIDLSQSLEKHFNGYYGEYYGFDCNDDKKLLVLKWDGIRYKK